MSAPKKIALIVGSTRNPRVGLPISQLLLKHLTASIPDPSAVQLELLDLMDHQLPYLNEPAVPMYVSSPGAYTHAATRAWSTLISSYAGYVFVTPQYNWGIPGGLKNNIDYLYNEWKGKPAMVVSYGGRGGGKAGEQLLTMLRSMKMVVGEDGERVELNLSLGEGSMMKAAGKGELGEEMEGKWEENGELEKARKLFGEVVAKAVEGTQEMGKEPWEK